MHVAWQDVVATTTTRYSEMHGFRPKLACKHRLGAHYWTPLDPTEGGASQMAKLNWLTLHPLLHLHPPLHLHPSIPSPPPPPAPPPSPAAAAPNEQDITLQSAAHASH